MNNYQDICARKHQDNENSIAANLIAAKHKDSDKETILRILAKGDSTSKELAVALRRALHSVSARIAELKRDKLIRIKPGVLPREGCAVLELITMSEEENENITAAVRREQMVKTILDLSAKCGYTEKQLNSFINRKFETDDGINSLDFTSLAIVRDGLTKKAAEIAQGEERS